MGEADLDSDSKLPESASAKAITSKVDVNFVRNVLIASTRIVRWEFILDGGL